MNQVNNIPVNFGSSPQQLSTKLMFLNNKLNTFSLYNIALWVNFILSILGLIGSIFILSVSGDINSRSINTKGYGTLSFFIEGYCTFAYFYAMQAFTKQSSSQNKNTEILLLGTASATFCFILYYVFVSAAPFFTWIWDLLMVILNVWMYYQAQELTNLFIEKENLTLRYN